MLIFLEILTPLTFNKSALLPRCIYMLRMIITQAAIVFIYLITQLASVIEIQSLHCETGRELLNSLINSSIQTVFCARTLVVGLSSWSNRFISRPATVSFAVDKVAFGQVHFRVLLFCPLVLLHYCSMIFFILILLLREGQESEAWGSSNKTVLFRILGNTGQKSFFTLPIFKLQEVRATDNGQISYKWSQIQIYYTLIKIKFHQTTLI